MWCSQCGNSAVSRPGEVCSQCRGAEYDGPDMLDPREGVNTACTSACGNDYDCPHQEGHAPDTNDPNQFPAESNDL